MRVHGHEELEDHVHEAVSGSELGALGLRVVTVEVERQRRAHPPGERTRVRTREPGSDAVRMRTAHRLVERGLDS